MTGHVPIAKVNDHHRATLTTSQNDNFLRIENIVHTIKYKHRLSIKKTTYNVKS